MELRQLNTDAERDAYARCLTRARATRGRGFREKEGSSNGRAHMLLGDMFGLFESEAAPLDEMRAGFIVHSAASFPLSYPKPDLTHLPPESVIEGSELWSLSPGSGRVAKIVAGAVVGMMRARAMVLYSLVKPIDLTRYYYEDGFINACDPVPWPYVETLEGATMWVQPLILEGGALERYIRAGFELLFRYGSSPRRMRFAEVGETVEQNAAAMERASRRVASGAMNGEASH
ncbi:MAG TPA: hypothetical protein VMT64_07545 [Candidatus Binataceae bacterium]|nr:hypothetical protein [Candidatus Binataceae bacterium]